MIAFYHPTNIEFARPVTGLFVLGCVEKKRLWRLIAVACAAVRGS